MQTPLLEEEESPQVSGFFRLTIPSSVQRWSLVSGLFFMVSIILGVIGLDADTLSIILMAVGGYGLLCALVPWVASLVKICQNILYFRAATRDSGNVSTSTTTTQEQYIWMREGKCAHSTQTPITVPPRMHMQSQNIQIRRDLAILTNIRIGDIEHQLQHFHSKDLSHLLPIIVTIISEIPFGMTILRNRVIGVLNERMMNDIEIRQAFTFFLHCYGYEVMVQKLWPTQWKQFESKMHPFYQSLGKRMLSRRQTLASQDAAAAAAAAALMSPISPVTPSSTRGAKSKRTFFNSKKDENANDRKSRKNAKRIKKNSAALMQRNASPAPPAPPPPMQTHYEKIKYDGARTQRDVQNRKRSHSVESGLGSLSHLNTDLKIQKEHCIVIKEDNFIKFFYTPFMVANVVPGFRIVAASNVHIIDPINGQFGNFIHDNNDEKVEKVENVENVEKVEKEEKEVTRYEIAYAEVKKIYTSNARPLLLDVFVRNRRKRSQVFKSCSLIMKKGDDLRKDCGILYMFMYFNEIWGNESLNLKYDGFVVSALTYKCIAMGFGSSNIVNSQDSVVNLNNQELNFGCIEEVSNCKNLKDVKSIIKRQMFKKKQISKLVTSAAGAYVASYVLGIRDRHYDNVLIKMDGTLFHIDFGFCLGDKLTLDTSKIAITKDLQTLMGADWKVFVELGMNAYIALREHYHEVIEFASVVFKYLYQIENVEAFIYQKLRMDIDDDATAGHLFRAKLEKAPSKMSTKIKNALHTLAQKS